MTDSIPISLGMQCTTSAYLKDKNIRKHSFPFDWMLAPPKFVFEMLYLLLKENMDPFKLVTEYFYVLDKKVDIDLNNVEHYFSVDNPAMPNKLNSRYDAVFPHDYSHDQEEVKKKYARRFQRLKDLILNRDVSLKFFYTSQSSPEHGNFTIDRREVVNDVFTNLRKMYDLIVEFHGSKFDMHIFDSLRKEDPNMFFSNIPNVHMHYLDQKNKFFEMLPQMLSININ